MRTPLLVLIALTAALLLAYATGLFEARAGDPDPAATATPAPEGRGVLRVVATLPAASTGRVAFQLHVTEATYRGDGAPLRKGFVDVVTVDGAPHAVWTVEDLPFGDYAVRAYHDANANGELDKGAFGIPSERYGFSRNARGRFGPPAWQDVRFRFAAETSRTEITLDG